MLDRVEAEKMAAAAAEQADSEEARQKQLKLTHQMSRGRRQRDAPKRLSTLGETIQERGSIIMKRASVLLIGDPNDKNERKGLFSCCLGGGQGAKYEVDPEPAEKKSESSEEEEDAW